MKCYLCKKEVTRAIRHFMNPKDRREVAKFRDLCEMCYPLQMDKEGYWLNGNIWMRKGVLTDGLESNREL